MHGASWVALSILQIQSIPFIILNAFTRRFNTNIHAWTRGLSNNVESIKYPEAVRSSCVTYCSVTWPAASHQVLVRSSYVFSGSSECLTPRAQRMSSTANTPVYTNLHQIWPAVQECPDRCTKAKPQPDRPWIRLNAVPSRLSDRAIISGSALDSILCVLNVGSELHRTQDRKLRYEFTWLTSRDPFKLFLIVEFESN